MSRKLVVDSSVLIILDRRGTLEQRLSRKRDEGYEVIVPKSVARELLEETRFLFGTLSPETESCRRLGSSGR